MVGLRQIKNGLVRAKGTLRRGPTPVVVISALGVVLFIMNGFVLNG